MSDLSALLDREASAEIEALLSEARERASEIAAQATAEAEQLVAQRRRMADGERDATMVRAQSAARLEAAALKLRAQHAAVEAVFDAARTKLDGIAGDAERYGSVLATLLGEVVDSVGAAEVTAVLAAAADVPTVTAAAKQLGLEAPVRADDGVQGGVRVVTKSGASVENTLVRRLEALEGELASRVSEVLFAERAGA